MNAPIPWPRILVEGAAIVMSILLAFGIQAWWEGRQELTATRQHLITLAQDFEEMEAVMDSVLAISSDAVAAGEALVRGLSSDAPEVLADSALSLLGRLIPFDPMRDPNTAAYDALAGTGRLELIDDRALVRDLGNFYGEFESLRVWEQLLVREFFLLVESTDFANEIGDAAFDPARVGAPPESVLRWSQSRRLRTDLALFAQSKAGHQVALAHMRDQIRSIRSLIELQLR